MLEMGSITDCDMGAAGSGWNKMQPFNTAPSPCPSRWTRRAVQAANRRAALTACNEIWRHFRPSNPRMLSATFQPRERTPC